MLKLFLSLPFRASLGLLLSLLLRSLSVSYSTLFFNIFWSYMLSVFALYYSLWNGCPFFFRHTIGELPYLSSIPYVMPFWHCQSKWLKVLPGQIRYVSTNEGVKGVLFHFKTSQAVGKRWQRFEHFTNQQNIGTFMLFGLPCDNVMWWKLKKCWKQKWNKKRLLSGNNTWKETKKDILD